jgi:hypothetical protein
LKSRQFVVIVLNGAHLKRVFSGTQGYLIIPGTLSVLRFNALLNQNNLKQRKLFRRIECEMTHHHERVSNLQLGLEKKPFFVRKKDVTLFLLFFATTVEKSNVLLRFKIKVHVTFTKGSRRQSKAMAGNYFVRGPLLRLYMCLAGQMYPKSKWLISSSKIRSLRVRLSLCCPLE